MQNSKEKKNFVNKFFLDCNSSPGGSFELIKKKPTMAPARKRRVEKILEKGKCSESKPAKLLFNFNNTTKKFLRNIHKKNKK